MQPSRRHLPPRPYQPQALAKAEESLRQSEEALKSKDAESASLRQAGDAAGKDLAEKAGALEAAKAEIDRLKAMLGEG